jgi:hypothetical protein
MDNGFTYKRVDQSDTDGDGMTNDQELIIYLTDPNNPDTDGDLINDGDEIKIYCSNPLDPDSWIKFSDGTTAASRNDGILDGHTETIRSDIDNSGRIDGFDLNYLSRYFNSVNVQPSDDAYPADINFDTNVDQADLDIMSLYFGKGFCVLNN